MNDNNINERDKQLDGMLDSVLAQYGVAEPLHGMEERVLRRLGEGPAARPWWVWGGVAAAALASVVLAVVLLSPTAEQKPVTPQAQKQSVPTQSMPKQGAPAQEAVAAGKPKHQAAMMAAANNLRPRNQGMPPVRTEVVMGGMPRRAVFPTPTPPTDQEILLARYVRVTPRDEVLAQANRKPLEFHEDPLSAPTGGGATSPNKADGMK
jgi:hypothetical protein